METNNPHIPMYEGTAEQRLLGALLTNPKIIIHLRESFKDHFFEVEFHRKLYGAMKELFDKYETYDPFLLIKHLHLTEYQWDICSYVTQCIEFCPSSSLYHAYADEVVEETTRAYLLQEAKNLEHVSSNGGDVRKILSDHKKNLEKLQEWKKNDTVQTLQEQFDDWVENQCNQIDEEKSDIKPYALMGYSNLDKLLHGVRKGQMHVIGARPGQGKSMFALNIAYNMARAGKKVLFCSLEMSNTETLNRLCSMSSCIPFEKITSNTCSDVEMATIMDHRDNIVGLPLVLKEAGGMSPTDLRNYLEEEAKTKNVDVVIIDYIQLMTPHMKTMYETVTRISNELKQIAMKYKVGVIALAQLNRDAANKEPQIHNLKESGALEQDADSILLLWRDLDPSSDETILRVLLRKNRNGVGNADVMLKVHFENMLITNHI